MQGQYQRYPKLKNVRNIIIITTINFCNNAKFKISKKI